MISVAFDPLAASKAFREAGLDERQAEAIASAMRQAAADRSDMATQADMVALKSDIGVQSVDIAALKTNVAAQKTDIGAMKADIAAQSADIAALKTDVTVLKTDVAAQSVDIAALKTNVAAQSADIGALRTDIAALESRIYRALWMQGAALAGLILAAKLF